MIEALLGGRSVAALARELIRPALYLAAGAVAWLVLSAHYYDAGYSAAMVEINRATADTNRAVYTQSEADALVRAAAERAREDARNAVFEELAREAREAPPLESPPIAHQSCPPQPRLPSCGLSRSVLEKINRVN